jgi:putative SbcD/Mre11-related phosphoesterase
MPNVEPVPDAPVAVVDTGDGRVLAVADYHAGYESWLRHEEDVHAESRAGSRRERLLGHVEATSVDRVVFLGDLAHFYGGPHGAERGEIELLLESLPVPATVVKGNHDGGIQALAGPAVTVTDTAGVRTGGVGFVHGHTWPAPDVLSADLVCIGHEHPCVRLEDPVGGRRVDRVWVRGGMTAEPFADRYEDLDWTDPELVVFPAFNELLGCTWVNEDDGFLAPFLPAALPAGDAYLLDGTRLGDYREV